MSWFIILLQVLTPNIRFHIAALGLAIGAKSILLVAASIVPGMFLVVFHKESRVFLTRVNAGVHVYVIALVIGFALPFSSYLGDTNPLWYSGMASQLIRGFAINILLSPLWEEALWRGYFYPKVSLMVSPISALLLGALGWTAWHLGYLFFLYENGIEARILLFLPIQYFSLGIILNCIFVLGKRSILPCIFLHANFNAAVAAYYGVYDRVASIGLYAAQTTTMCVAATLLFVLARSKLTESRPALVP